MTRHRLAALTLSLLVVLVLAVPAIAAPPCRVKPVPGCRPDPTPTVAPTPVPTPAPTPVPGGSLTLPVRAAFYYPWFPEAWNQQGFNPFTRYHPSLGFYDSGSASVIQAHVAAMQGARIQAGIASWWGQGSRTDSRISALLANAGSFRWTLYYEPEGSGDPSVTALDADLDYIAANYASQPAWLRIGGKPVIFVWGSGTETCATVDRWIAANAGRFHLVMKVFTGYRTCAQQPNHWHQYGPAVAADRQTGHSFTISPGFWRPDEATPRLARDPARWQQNVASMVASGEPWQLITTFNEWGEGTSVESATEWGTIYLDILGGASPPPTPAPTPVPTPAPTPPAGSAVLLAAGDIAKCDSTGDEATANLLDSLPGTVAALGDDAYESGTLTEFNQCYGPSWGRHKARTKPAPGNHEWLTANAQGYRDYFGYPGALYYAYDLGAWRVYVLDSDCSKVGGCAAGSPQYTWLSNDLAANPRQCVLAYWHHPKFTIGPHANDEGGSGVPFWTLLQQHGAELVLNGHDHNYQRWTPMLPDGTVSATGIRLIVNGAGGANHTVPTRTDSRVQASNSDTFGILKLTLSAGSYSWQFIPEAGKTFTDSGSSACH